MHYKVLTAITLAVVFALTIKGSDSEGIEEGVVRTEFVDDLAIELSSTKPHEMFGSSNRIEYGFVTQTNDTSVVYFLQDAYFCLAKMYDSNGMEVQARSLGSELGKHFFMIKEPYEDKVRIRRAHGTDSAHLESTSVHRDGSEGHYFYTPDELFIMNGKGKYKLILQFQVLEMALGGATNSGLQLVRFAPLEVPVVKTSIDTKRINSWSLVYFAVALACAAVVLVFLGRSSKRGKGNVPLGNQ